MDLSQFSTDDLKALQSGDLTKVSTQGLKMLQQATPAPVVASPAVTSRIQNDAITQDAKAGPSMLGEIGSQIGNLVAGGIRGAGSIGSTIMTAADKLHQMDPIATRNDQLLGLPQRDPAMQADAQRRAGMDAGLAELGADTQAPAFKAGKFGAEVAGTAGTGSVLANTLRAVPVVARVAPNLLNSVRTGGMVAAPAGADAPVVVNALTRATGGAINGGATAGLVDPSQAGSGAMIGGAFPVSAQALGSTAKNAGNLLRGGGVSPEVVNLADRAKELGINIPADRIVNSKPLNALAASLNYVPLSGRAGTEAAMNDQLNTALSKTFGQDSPNVTQALRKASGELGQQFDTVLKSNTVKMTPDFKQALADASDQATKELGPDQANIIQRQIAEIQTKGLSGEIDGQTAYNIKKTLDRIGDRNSPEAFYARDLKKKLMTALNDSMAPEDAQAFAKLRQQYGNMLDLQNLASNGAEGGVSIGRLANLKNIGNPDVQELADIAAQFMRTRENPHGALQRLVIGGTAPAALHGVGALPVLPATIAAGRGANMLLNSNAARNYVIGRGAPNALSRLPTMDDLVPLARVAPNALSDQ